MQCLKCLDFLIYPTVQFKHNCFGRIMATSDYVCLISKVTIVSRTMTQECNIWISEDQTMILGEHYISVILCHQTSNTLLRNYASHWLSNTFVIIILNSRNAIWLLTHCVFVFLKYPHQGNCRTIRWYTRTLKESLNDTYSDIW